MSYVKMTGRCINCLGRHPFTGCTSRYKCYNCNEAHNSTLCPNRQIAPSDNNRIFMDNNTPPSCMTQRTVPSVLICTDVAADGEKEDECSNAVNVLQSLNCESVPVPGDVGIPTVVL